jgi:pyruvate carboxylase
VNRTEACELQTIEQVRPEVSRLKLSPTNWGPASSTLTWCHVTITIHNSRTVIQRTRQDRLVSGVVQYCTFEPFCSHVSRIAGRTLQHETSYPLSKLHKMPQSKPFTSLLVANRGEIAQRILQSARELGLETYALHTSEDLTHARFAHHALSLPGPESYMDAERIINLCIQHRITAIHPGYGFLSESANFAARAEAAGIIVVGPGALVLAKTGDKLEARRLATSCGVPVLEALGTPTRDVRDVEAFASRVGYPIMIKAVDGGGGRGIRLVRKAVDLGGSFKRAVEESPSKLVFAEKAAVDGYLHVEVQIVGDGTSVIHLLERQCSIQRRYQKVVEVAPCVRADRNFIKQVIDAAVTMAKSVRHLQGIEKANLYR